MSNDMPEEIWIAENEMYKCGGLPKYIATEIPIFPQIETKYIRADLVPQWHPIETAPKPSGQVILATPRNLGGYDVVNGHWFRTENKWVYDCHFAPDRQPTHWMPLPQPPQEKEDH